MTNTEIERFHQEVRNDPALQKRLGQAKDDSSLAALALQIGQEKGYKFTKSDVESYIKSTRSQHELSDQQLEAIAGGKGQYFDYNKTCKEE